MKIAVLTCVYPSVSRFLPEFFESLKNQSDGVFDLLIGNDGMSELKDGIPPSFKGLQFFRNPSRNKKTNDKMGFRVGI